MRQNFKAHTIFLIQHTQLYKNIISYKFEILMISVINKISFNIELINTNYLLINTNCLIIFKKIAYKSSIIKN